ncbi:MAG: HD-GYP domain-containing protein [Chloroflexota bacterium]
MKINQTPLGSSYFEEMIDLSNLVKSIFYVAILSIVLISLNVLQGDINNSDLSAFILLVISVILFRLYRKGYIKAAGISLFIAISIVVTYNLAVAGGIHDNVMVIFPVLITFSGLLFGKRIIPILTTIIVAEASIIYWLTITEVITPYNGRIETDIQDFLTVVILLTASGALIWLTINVIENGFLQVIESENKLSDAYNQTIDGWGRALELFNQETEGHSLRVTDLTLKIARTLKIDQDQIEEIRRGTLLHDIGKMGIPDEILKKPGALTQEERQVVEKHPENAYNLLKDIPFLEKALDIPYCHHEQWDGHGYPRNLKGEEIPLSARIFAIVDNWDALISDRPYRKAWSREKTIAYLREESGKKFDPKLVELFIETIN